MGLNWSPDVPVLFFNSGAENGEAYRFLRSSDIECEFRAVSDGPTPLLLVGYQKFIGLAEIRKFVSEQFQKKDTQANSQ